MVRPLFRAPLPVLAALGLFAACSSESTDFFGGIAGSSGEGTGGSASGRAPVSGTSGSGAGRGGSNASGGSAQSGGTGAAGGATGANGGVDAGGSNAGSAPVSGAGGNNEGGEGGDAVGGGAGMPDEVGGAGGLGGTGGGGIAGGGTDAGGTGATGGGGAGAGGSGAVSGSGGTSAGSGGSSGTGGGCKADPDCDDDEYCSKQACNDSTGTCATRPEACRDEDAVFNPVCGCDDMTYYSPCVAAREGVSVKGSGECSGANLPACNREAGGDSCRPQRTQARCYRPRTDCDGTSAMMGVCWVLPDECPEEDEVNLYCGGTSGESECVGLCEVLDREDAVFRNSPACSD